MIVNAEMKLRASIFRTESRGAHYRDDYPARNNEQWPARVIISLDGDKMKLNKKPLPEPCKPDPGIRTGWNCLGSTDSAVTKPPYPTSTISAISMMADGP